MILFDRVSLDYSSSRRRTADGYLVAIGRAARAGIQVYAGREVGRPDLETVRVYRAPEEVFARDALASYAHKPVTNDHPPAGVNPQNWRSHAVGFVGDEVSRDGDFVRVSLMLADAAAISALETGKRELSAGYDCVLDWTPGVAPDGQRYEARQRAIKVNHVAIVTAGRAGPVARIADGASSTGSGGWGEGAYRLAGLAKR